MDRLSTSALAAGLVASASSFGLVQPYFNDFDSLDRTSLTALSDTPSDLVTFMSVWADADKTIYEYGYGVFPAPNDIVAPNISVITDAADGIGSTQSLNVFNDYNNIGEHDPASAPAPPNLDPSYVETNVFLEQTIAAANIGQEWTFSVEAARPASNPVSSSRLSPNIPNAAIFIKTIDPGNGFATTNFLELATDDLGAGVETRSLTISLDDPALENQLLQVGFTNFSFQFSPTSVLYDNVSLSVPEPASLALIGTGVLAGFRRRR